MIRIAGLADSIGYLSSVAPIAECARSSGRRPESARRLRYPALARATYDRIFRSTIRVVRLSLLPPVQG